jgi:hypothetical protein
MVFSSFFVVLSVISISSQGYFDTVFISSLGVLISILLICDSISHTSIPDFSAILHSTGLSIIHGSWMRNPLSIACS